MVAFLVLILLFGKSQAHAALQGEPYVGYWSGALQQEAISDIATSGALFGGRAGFGTSRVAFGLDYMLGSGSGNQGGNSGDYKLNEFGPFASLQVTESFRVYVTAFVSSRAKIQPKKNPNSFSGSGFRFGLGGGGWGGLKFLSLNFEYFLRTFKKYNGVELSQKIAEHAVAISISVPIPSSKGASSSPSSDVSPSSSDD